MSRRSFRAGSVLAVIALVAAACGPATTSPSTASSGSPGASTPASSASTSTGVVDIRWFCCLGGGDAPEQVPVEKKVVEDFNASHPNIHLTFEAIPYAGANDALATQIGSVAVPDIVGPVGIGGANAFHGQSCT